MKRTVSACTSGSFLEKVIESLDHAGQHHPGEVAPPAAVLWTDADGQWRPLVTALRARLPQLLTLGEYEPDIRTGPAIWLKCVIGGALDRPAIPEGSVPIVYLPGINRQTIRAGEECPQLLKPLVELQYRGAVWTQRNGKDLTVEAFLVSEEGLGLDVARDSRTRASMLGALTVLAGTPVSQLTGRRLEAEDFDLLLVGDPVRDLLAWMNDPEGVGKSWDDGRWKAFRSRCKSTYKFDPEADGETVAGERLGLAEEQTPWQGAWERFTEAPSLYPGLPQLLRRSKPAGTLLFRQEPWPDENENAERQLREALVDLENVNGAEARRILLKLESEHCLRRQWVWARMGQAPLAQALEHLAVLAEHCASTLGGETPGAMARLYAEGAFRADYAALEALAAAKTLADAQAVRTAVRAVYLPWIQASAEHFQELLAQHPLPDKRTAPIVDVAAGECILFSDGLRFDLAQKLLDKLEERGLRTSQQHRWAALPSVTATAKPAVSPIIGKLTGTTLPEDFCPEVGATGQPLTTDRFRKLLGEAGYTYFGSDRMGAPGNPEARGWTEFGQIDARGHDLQIDLAAQIDDELERLCERVVGLLDAGWRAIRIVTDHGWLLMPGGLPKCDLPGYLVASRWARCAAIKGSSKVAVPKAAWFWNAADEFATAPGAACFVAGNDYAHGGLSVQECLIADLRVTPSEDSARISARITDVSWVGQRCRVAVEPADPSVRVDLRTKPNAPDASIAGSVKAVDAEGRASLVVENEDLAGTVAVVVLIDNAGRVLARQPTTVGEGE